MNILITGGTGNLGSRLAIPLIRRGDKVVLFDVRRNPLANAPEIDKCTVMEADLRESEAVLGAVKGHSIESIFHLGALLSANAEQRPDEAWRVNMDGTRNVLEAARKCKVKQVVFSSTLATYGAGLPTPLPIDAPQWPVSLYGATKVAGERLGVYYHHRFGLDFRGIRFPAVIAPRGAPGGASAFCSAVFVESVLRGGYEFYLRPETHCPVLYIADAVRALVNLHDAAESQLRHRVYNVAGFGPSAQELAEAVLKRLPQVKITYNPDPVRNAIVNSWPSEIDDSDARSDWGWKADYGMDRTADEVIEALQRESRD